MNLHVVWHPILLHIHRIVIPSVIHFHYCIPNLTHFTSTYRLVSNFTTHSIFLPYIGWHFFFDTIPRFTAYCSLTKLGLKIGAQNCVVGILLNLCGYVCVCCCVPTCIYTSVYMHFCTYTHVCIYIHIYIHIPAHRQIIHTCTHTHTHTNTHKHTRTHKQTHTQKNTNTHKDTNLHTHTHSNSKQQI